MNFFPTSIPEVIRVEPRVFGDARGFFMETYRADQMAAAGIPNGGSKTAIFGARLQQLRASLCLTIAELGVSADAEFGDGN